mgnify:CR=1 FL=1
MIRRLRQEGLSFSSTQGMEIFKSADEQIGANLRPFQTAKTACGGTLCSAKYIYLCSISWRPKDSGPNGD